MNAGSLGLGFRHLLIAQIPSGSKLTETTLHKVAMSFPTQYYKSKQEWETSCLTDAGLPYNDTPLDCFSIGGKACSYCQAWKNGKNELLSFDLDGYVKTDM